MNPGPVWQVCDSAREIRPRNLLAGQGQIRRRLGSVVGSGHRIAVGVWCFPTYRG